MNHSIADVLKDKKGIVEALGAVVIAMALLVGVGSVVGNYAVLSKQAAQLSALSQEVTNRAETYVSELNADLITPQSPAMTRTCSTTTESCTQILSVTPSADGAQITLRIQADSAVVLGQTVTQDVVLVSEEVTHVTGIDADGNNAWALTKEGPRFRTWGLAEGKPVEVDEDKLTGPTVTNKWVQVEDRAGIDAAGALWVWGKNDIGQAGVGTKTTTPVAPKRVSADGQKFRFVVTEDDRGYAIDSAGHAWVWGKNTLGQLGLGHTSAVLKPTMVPSIRFMTITVGKDTAAALTTAGELLVTGAKQQYYSADVAGTSWRPLDGGTRYIAASSAVTNGGLALIQTDGILVVNGSPAFSPSGVEFVSVSRGGTAGYALSSAGELYSWGQGANGQLGLGATPTVSIATKMPSTPKMIAIQGGETGAWGLDAAGALYYVGKVSLNYDGGGVLPTKNVLTRYSSIATYRQMAGDSGSNSLALLDQSGNLYGLGTGTAAGLWPMDYRGGPNELVRMPVPADFLSYTWK